MKPIEQVFLADILESPDDDAPRLIYADWLEENGQAERAEFIRIQCKLWPLRETGRLHAVVCCCELCLLRRRERELFDARKFILCGPVLCRLCPNHVSEYHRGFVEELTLPLADWLQHGPALVKAAPLRVVQLSDIRLVPGVDDITFLSVPYLTSSYLPTRDIHYQFLEKLRTIFRSEADARGEISRCCLEYARGQNTKTVQA